MDLRASVRLRATAERNVPGTAVRWDPGTGGFALSGYLTAEGERSFASALASVGLEGRLLDGDLRWLIALDTGEVRRERHRRVAEVCWSESAPSGLAVPGSGQCSLYRVSPLAYGRVIVPVETTALEEAETTSNGRPFHEEVSHTLLVREAYLAYRFGRADLATFTLGRKRTVVADGYVHDDYALGAELSADLGAVGPPFALSAAAFLPSRDLPERADRLSPMAVLRADWLPSLFERAGLFAAGLRVRGEGLENLFRGAIQERLVVVATENEPGTRLHQRASQLLAATGAAPLAADGTLGWLGTSGLLTVGKAQRLSFTGALVGGEIQRVTAGRAAAALAEKVSLRGQLASLRYQAELGGHVGAGASFLFLSGGELPRVARHSAGVVPAAGVYRGFLGVSPYLDEASLFFGGGGLSESYADRKAQAPGVNGRGVVAPGVSLRWDPEDLSLVVRGTWLRAVEPGPFGGLLYGAEVDASLEWRPAGWLVVGLEADALFPGDFFRGRGPVTRGLLAVDVLTP